MIAIARRNLSCLHLNPNSLLCNSNLNFYLSIHLFSTSRARTLIFSPQIYDLLVSKHHFPPELASLAASRLHEFKTPKRADSVVLFLKENSFTAAQLQKIVLYNPRILAFTVDRLKFKFKVFLDLGLSPVEIAKIMCTGQSILHSSVENRILPKLSMLKMLLGSDHNVARLIRKSTWFLTSDLEKTLMPNLEVLKGCGTPMERVLHFLYTYPRCFLNRPDMFRKSVDKAIGYGISQASVAFIHSVIVFGSTSEGMWEAKFRTFQDLGFSNSDVFAIFRRSPLVFSLSMVNVRKTIELLLATGKYNISNIVVYPVSLGCSVKNRLEPRMEIMRVLESSNLIEMWPSLRSICSLSDDKFVERFVSPYSEKVGEAFRSMSYLKGKMSET